MANVIVKHPAFDDVTETVDESAIPDWKAAGWKPLLDDVQTARLAELEAEVTAEVAAQSDHDDTPPADETTTPPRSRKPRNS